MRPVIGITCSTLVLDDLRGVPRYALARSYTECVEQAGGLPWLLPSLGPERAPEFLERLDGLVLSGGLDVDPAHYDAEPHPDLGQVDGVRDLFELALCRAAHARRLPVLAICRGVQVANVALGGTLLQHIPAQVPGALKHDQAALRNDALCHSVEVGAGTRLAALLGVPERLRVNSFHHQAVDRPASGLVVNARAPDGVVEGLEDPAQPFFLGVQWHPERRPTDPVTRALFAGLVEAAQAFGRAEPAQPRAPVGR